MKKTTGKKKTDLYPTGQRIRHKSYSRVSMIVYLQTTKSDSHYFLVNENIQLGCGARHVVSVYSDAGDNINRTIWVAIPKAD